jgi:hypothetical protein
MEGVALDEEKRAAVTRLRARGSGNSAQHTSPRASSTGATSLRGGGTSLNRAQARIEALSSLA